MEVKWADPWSNDWRVALLRSDQATHSGETVVSGLHCERVSAMDGNVSLEGCLLKDPAIRTAVEGVELQGAAVSLTESIPAAKTPRSIETRVESINADMVVPAGVFEVPADVHFRTRRHGKEKTQAGEKNAPGNASQPGNGMEADQVKQP